jgi:hypothetical protein
MKKRSHYHWPLPPMPHVVDLSIYSSVQMAAVLQWCKETYAKDAWRCDKGYPGYVKFAREQDKTMFLLRWTNEIR